MAHNPNKRSDRFIDIRVFSYVDAALYSCLVDLPPTIVISIDDKGFAPTPFDFENTSLLAVLKLNFADTEDENSSIAMTEYDAEKIISFVERHLPLRPQIVVHCAGGISRSPGVAAALNRWLNGDDTPITDNPHYSPNFLCYQRVCQAAGIEYFDEEAERARFDKLHQVHHEWLEHGYDDVLFEENLEGEAGIDFWSDETVEANERGWQDVREKLKEKKSGVDLDEWGI